MLVHRSKKALTNYLFAKAFLDCADTIRNVRISGIFFVFQGKNPQAYLSPGKYFQRRSRINLPKIRELYFYVNTLQIF